MDTTKAKSELGRQLATLRHLSLTPERRKEIAQKAAAASAKVRGRKKHLTDSENTISQSAPETVA